MYSVDCVVAVNRMLLFPVCGYNENLRYVTYCCCAFVGLNNTNSTNCYLVVVLAM